MRYFLLKTDPMYSSAPKIMDWYNKVNPKHIHKGASYPIPKRQIIHVESNLNTFFTDIVSSPLFLVSQIVRDTIKMYEPQIIFKEIVLLDRENKLTQLYFLPVFEELRCLANESELSLDRSIIKKAVLQEKAIAGNHIFRIEDVSSTYIVADMDFVESVLRRGAKGISLTELEVSTAD